MTRMVSMLLLAVAFYLGIWDCVVKLTLSAVHVWLIDVVGRTGLWIVIGMTTLGGGWALWVEQEDR